MAILDEVTMPTQQEVEKEAIKVLLGELGPTKTAMFLQNHFPSKTDSVALKRELFDDMSLEEIVSEIEKMRAAKAKNASRQ